MNQNLNKDNFDIWEAVSYAWTEIGMEEKDYKIYAEKFHNRFTTWDEIDRIIKKDVCASFGFDSFLLFPCMLWMILPDWGYNEDYLRERMNKWYAKPYYGHFLNPFRIVGYPIALLLSFSVRRNLKKAFTNLMLKP